MSGAFGGGGKEIGREASTKIYFFKRRFRVGCSEGIESFTPPATRLSSCAGDHLRHPALEVVEYAAQQFRIECHSPDKSAS